MFTSKRISLLTILALLIPTSAGIAGFGSSAANAATTLDVFTINGEDVSGLENDSTVTLETYTTSVAVVATATDVTATTVVTLNGTVDGTAVSEGSNTLVVTVTDSELSTATTTLNLVVPVGDKTNSTITLNGLTLGNGDSTDVAYGTTSLPISVTLDDARATVMVNGVALTKDGSVASGTVEGLETGENSVRVLVTAADATNSDETQITVNVAPNNNAGATLVVNGQNVESGDTVVLDPLTTDAEIEVNTVDPNATYEITGGSDLLTTADNLVVIRVTAEDGVTVVTYNLTIQVGKNDNADLDLLLINGNSVSEGDTVELPYETTTVTFEVYPSDIDATYVVTGGTGLTQGENDLIVTITAANGQTVAQYVVTLKVADPDVTLSNFKFNGSNVAVDTVVSTYAQSNFLALAPTDSRATVSVALPEVAEGETNPYLYDAATGALTLPLGETEITVTVTGHDGATTADYVFTVLKAGIRVDFEGNTVDPIAVTEGQIVEVPAGTLEVALEVLAPEDATVDIEGDKDLVTGLNDVYVVITDADLRTITTTFQVRVLPAGGTLTSFTVNEDEVILDGTTGAVTLEAGTTSVDVAVEAVDSGATYVVTGNSGLVLGANVLTVVLTTSDGATFTYTVTLTVPASDNAEFDAITINGALFEDQDLVEVDAGVIDVQVDTQDSNAVVVITPSVSTVTEPAAVEGEAPTVVLLDGTTSKVAGVINASGYVTLDIVVTAQDGLVTESAQINLLASTDLGVFNGSSVTDDELRVGTYAKLDSTITRSQFETGAGLKYKWTVDGDAVPNATTTRFLLTPAHLEAEVRPVVTSLIGGRTKTVIGKKLDVALGLIKKAPTPVVQGKSALGSTLKAISKSWSKDVELSYKWYVNYDAAEENTPVGTDETFVLGSDVALNDVITLGVSGSLEGYATLEKLSAPMTVTRGIIKFTTRPSFDEGSTFVTAGTVTVEPGATTNADAEFTYEWTHSGSATVIGTEAEYELTPADFNKKLSVKVTSAADDYDSASVTLKTPTIKAGTLEEVEAPTITRGATSLTAVGGFSADATATSVQYVWYRNGRIITDAKASTYTLRTKDALGTVFSVRVIGKYLGFKSTSAIADPEEPFVLAAFVEAPPVVIPPVVPPVVPAP